MSALVLCMWCHHEITDDHACIRVRPRADEHAEALAAALDADADEQARTLAVAIYELGGELLALVSSGEAVLAFPTAAPAGFQLILGDGKGSFDDEHPIQASLPDPADRAVLIDAHETAPLCEVRSSGGTRLNLVI